MYNGDLDESLDFSVVSRKSRRFDFVLQTLKHDFNYFLKQTFI